MRVAITGGTGFIGGHLATRLSSEGHEVVRIGRRSTGEEVVKAPLDDVDQLATAFLQVVRQSHIARVSIEKSIARRLSAFTSTARGT